MGKNPKKINRSQFSIAILICGLWLWSSTIILASSSDESEVRNAVQHIFNQLKNGQYAEVYDALPATTRKQFSRDRFVSALQRSQGIFRLQRIEIGAPHVSGNIAVVDTTMFAHVSKPFDADGKLLAQQYLIRENGSWHVVTGDNATINRFLQANPSFARKFPIKRPHTFINQNGKWIEIPLGRRKP